MVGSHFDRSSMIPINHAALSLALLHFRLALSHFRWHSQFIGYVFMSFRGHRARIWGYFGGNFASLRGYGPSGAHQHRTIRKTRPNCAWASFAHRPPQTQVGTHWHSLALFPLTFPLVSLHFIFRPRHFPPFFPLTSSWIRSPPSLCRVSLYG